MLASSAFILVICIQFSSAQRVSHRLRSASRDGTPGKVPSDVSRVRLSNASKSALSSPLRHGNFAFGSALIKKNAEPLLIQMSGMMQDPNQVYPIYNGEVWSSSDRGKTWCKLPDPKWPSRQYFGTASDTLGRLWVFGGYGDFTNMNGSAYLQDTWVSEDQGHHWIQLNTSLNVSAMGSAVLSNGVLLSVGGQHGANKDVFEVWALETRRLKNANWSLWSNSSSIPPRRHFGTVVLADDTVLVLGGHYNQGVENRAYNDVWALRPSPKDAHVKDRDWQLVTPDAGWQCRYSFHAQALSDDSIVILGGVVIPENPGEPGVDTNPSLNDVWRSHDRGKTWKQIQSSAAWSPRGLFGSVLFPDGELTIFGGLGDRLVVTEDIWSSKDGGKTWNFTASGHYDYESTGECPAIPQPASPKLRNQALYVGLPGFLAAVVAAKLLRSTSCWQRRCMKRRRKNYRDSSTIGTLGSGQSDFDDMCSQHHEAGLNEIAFSDLLLEKEIGQGGFGKVFLAKWQGTHVAVKQVLRATQAGRDSLREEFKMAFHLRSPRIAQVLGCACDPMASMFCLVLEYASGGSVRSRLNERGVPDYDNALQWALDVAQGMDFLHKHDKIHCDLKGANVLLAHDGTSERAKVADFGLARALQAGGSGQSHSKDVQGSPAWMAPESINGEFTIHSDRYSYGIFLWELITAEIPWNNISPYSILYRVTFEHARPPLPQNLEHPLAELMERCWDEDAEMRPCFSICTQTLQALMQGSVVNDLSQ